MRALNIIVFFLWPMSVYAAGGSLGSTMGAVTTADWLSIFLLSLISGAVAFLRKMKLSFEYEANLKAGIQGDASNKQVIDWRIDGAVQIIGSLFAGFLAFLFAQWLEWNSYLSAICISLFAFGGAKVAEKLSDAMTDRVSSLISQKPV